MEHKEIKEGLDAATKKVIVSEKGNLVYFNNTLYKKTEDVNVDTEELVDIMDKVDADAPDNNLKVSKDGDDDYDYTITDVDN